MNIAKELRKVGLLEQYSSSRHSLGLYSCIVDTCEYAIPASLQEPGHLESAIRLALKDVITKIPSLSVGIKDESSKNPVFVRLGSVKLSDHLTWQRFPSKVDTDSLQSLTEILGQQHSTFFNEVEERPPWRVVCAQFAADPSMLHVSFAIHHSLGDGTSAGLFHICLFEALNSFNANTEQLTCSLDDVPVPEDLSLPPPLEEPLRLPISWSFLLKTLWAEVAPRWLPGATNGLPWAGKPFTAEPNQSKIRIVELDAVTFSQVLKACRAHKTTLTPLLHAIVLAAMSKHLAISQETYFNAMTPINLRPFVKELGGTPSTVAQGFGVFVTSQDHRFDKGVLHNFRSCTDDPAMLRETIWAAASQVTTELERKRKQIPNDDPVGLLPYVSDFHGRWQNMLGSDRQVTWEVSNIGSIPAQAGDDPERWRIKRSIFTQPGNAVGPAFSVNVTGVSGSAISIAFCWQDGVVETALMDKLAQEAKALLMDIASL